MTLALNNLTAKGLVYDVPGGFSLNVAGTQVFLNREEATLLAAYIVEKNAKDAAQRAGAAPVVENPKDEQIIT